MIYFVVAQKDDDGEWEIVFGPKGDIDGIDEKVAEAEEDPKYSQVEWGSIL